MKKFFFFSFVCLLSFISLPAQQKNPDTVMHHIFNALNNKDEQAFVKLFPSMQQMQKLIRKVMNEANVPDKKSFDSTMNVEINKLNDTAYKTEMENKFSTSFLDIIEAGEKRGIVWKKTKLLQYKFDSVTTSSPSMKMLKGELSIGAGDSVYKIAFDNIIWVPEENAWFGVQLNELIRAGEKWTYNNSDQIKTGEVDLKTVEDPVPPPPPPAKKKPVIKKKKG